MEVKEGRNEGERKEERNPRRKLILSCGRETEQALPALFGALPSFTRDLSPAEGFLQGPQDADPWLVELQWQGACIVGLNPCLYFPRLGHDSQGPNTVMFPIVLLTGTKADWSTRTPFALVPWPGTK